MFLFFFFFKSTDRYRSDLYISIDSVNFSYKIFFFLWKRSSMKELIIPLTNFLFNITYIYLCIYYFCTYHNGPKKILKRFYIVICFIFFFVPGGDPVLLSGGIHSFPFKLGLPLGLPSTFLGKHGWVQYFCKAALREESGLTHKNQQVFIIMNPIDLNLEPPILAVRFIMHFFFKN